MNQLLHIPVEEIRENPVALRTVNRQAETFQELIDSVKAEGILNPISVREKPGEDGKKYEIMDGLHRYTVAVEVGMKTIPGQIVSRSDAEALVAQVVANVQRVNTKPTEYAKGLQRILSHNPTMTEAQLASKLSKSPAWISATLELVKLDKNIQRLVDEGKIVLSNAYPMTKLPVEEQPNWLERAMTTPPVEFGPQVLARVKEIRDANRKGRSVGPEVFVAIPHLRNKKELDIEMRNPQVLPKMLKELKIKDPLEACILGLQWALNFDPTSQEAQRIKHEENVKRLKDQSDRRKEEQKAKKEKEAAEAKKIADQNPAPAAA